jgi:asparagine synthase (glutamine-hydrolysing)
MCGITGLISVETIDRDAVTAMTMALHHRGPDAQGICFDDTSKIALGHTRLSIIDLSTSANQPFYSNNKRYAVVFNGEIYNFLQLKKELKERHGIQFRTTSDTEVIAEAFAQWGVSMISRLEGMFAIAIADLHEKKVYLFRDRIGKKPLFYFQSDRLFAFASELKSLLKHPLIGAQAEVDVPNAILFLHLGYIPEPKTIYRRIFKFPAGHTGIVDHNLDFKSYPFWTIGEELTREKIRNTEQAKNKLDSLLDTAVQKRLISDVPLGAFLSGGVDSSLVTAYAAKHKKGIKTFSIGFREQKYDERKYAAGVAKHLGTDHNEYLLSEQEAVSLVEKYTNHFDEPFADTSAIPTMMISGLARNDVKVALTGDGGDELFQGYGAYTWARRLNSLQWQMASPFLRPVFRNSGNNRMQRVVRMLNSVGVGGIRSHIFSQEQYFFSQREIVHELLRDEKLYEPFEYEDDPVNSLSPGEKQALFDIKYYLKDDLLVKVDRASMYYALECRCPLLDHQVVGFAFSLHQSLKVRSHRTKWLLKEILSQKLPGELVNRPKWGFSVPLASWLKNELRYLIGNFLNDSVIEEIGIFKTTYIKQLVRDFLSGKEFLYNRIWVLIVLHKWLKENQSEFTRR